MDPIEQPPKASPYIIPASIIVAGAFIAGAIFYANKPAPTIQPAKTVQQKIVPIPPISATEHILGNPTAPVVMVEYSDPECPFCKRFHETMKQVIEKYGKDGKGAWVYRHFPLDQLHPKARNEATALECAGEQGGNNKFWEYTNRLYEVTPSNNGLDPAELPKIAQYVSLDVQKFNNCLVSGKYSDKIEGEYQDAIAGGGSGTPFTVLLLKTPVTAITRTTLTPIFAPYTDQNGQPLIVIGDDGLSIRMSGALPYELLKTTLDTLLKN